jgi:hypothetical protein
MNIYYIIIELLIMENHPSRNLKRDLLIHLKIYGFTMLCCCKSKRCQMVFVLVTIFLFFQELKSTKKRFKLSHFLAKFLWKF